MSNSTINQILDQNDRKGERTIALIQATMAFTIFLLHILSGSHNHWETLSPITIMIAATILIASMLRINSSYEKVFNKLYSHILTVIDGLLIYGLILSYNLAYNLPLAATFKAPTIIFLGVYAIARILRSDPWSIITAGATVLFGWLGLFFITMMSNPDITHSYAEYISTDKILVGAIFEFAVGFLVIMAILAFYTKSARQFLANTAHIEDLAIANMKAEENILIFEDLLNSSIDGIVIVDQNGDIERINPAMQALFKYEEQELVGKNVSGLMSSQNAKILSNTIRHYMKTDESKLVGHSFDSIGVRKDGSEFEIEISISEFFASGRHCFAGFIRDATVRKQALSNEKRSKAQFENALNAAMDAVIIIDQDGCIQNFNPAAEATFGYKFEDISGKKLSEVIIPQRHRNAHENGMNHYKTTGEGPVLGNRIEIEGLHASGEEIDIELAVREIEGASGKLFIGYARDITERKEFEAKLLATKNAAEVATRAKTSFLAMMSHEIRTPLNGVLGIHGLLKETKLDDDQKQLLETASESGESLLTIINDLLDFSKLEAGKFDIEKRPFNLSELVTSVINLIQPHANEKHLKLSYEIDHGIAKKLIGDPARIRQILLNLAWNAIKFTDNGSVKIMIEQRNANMISFTVKDTGIGIPSDKQNDLFTEFATIDSTYTSKFGGTGLGLAICKTLVENMGGEIGFSSNPNNGSRFWFNLHLDVSEEVENTAIEFDTDDDIIGDLSGVRVLIAEDNKTNQLVTSRYLQHYGCEFEIANNGIEAVEKLMANDFDIILMDISMPEMNGFEATAKIRQLENKQKANAPIVAFTAYASTEDQEKIHASGMNGFIPKPFSRDTLAQVISLQASQAHEIDHTKIEVFKSPLEHFDIEILNTILDDMDKETTSQIFAEFNKDIERYLSNTKDGLAQQDIQTIESSSHGLKGVSGMFGALELSKLADRLNQKCNQEDHEDIYEEATQLIIKAQEIIESTRAVEDYYLTKTGTGNDE